MYVYTRREKTQHIVLAIKIRDGCMNLNINDIRIEAFDLVQEIKNLQRDKYGESI